MANPSNNVLVTPAAPFTEWSELNFQGLYLFHTPKGLNTNQIQIIDSKAPIGIGATTVNNWEVYDGPGMYETPKLVARAQGLHAYAGNWANSFSLVFVDESGSTLQVMGIVVETGEWAIVGGTGQFVMATGVISKKHYESTSGGRDIIELTIRAFCPHINGTKYPVTKIGPWGGSGGTPIDIIEAPRRLDTIAVNAGWVVDSISFTYVDHTGRKRGNGRWGGTGGDGPRIIVLGESEVITEVSGTAGNYYDATVGVPFSIPVQPGSAIVGFFARQATYIHAIGVYVSQV